MPVQENGEPAGRQTTIMVVDDTPANLKLLDELLRGRGFRVVSFPSGSLALAAARKQPPDLVLLDVSMPDMDGFEACGQFKQTPELQRIPIIFVSALGEVFNKVKAFEMGAVDYVTKPFQVEEVLARVETHLKLRRLQCDLEHKYAVIQDLESWRNNLVHMIVHDLRSPLQGILGYVQLALMDEQRLDPDLQSALRAIEQTGISMKEMVSDLLDVSRLEEKKLPLQCMPVDIGQLISEFGNRLRTPRSEKKITVVPPSTPVKVECDLRLIRRVITNLVDNALQFTPKGKPVYLLARAKDGKVRIEVEDQGVGIPADLQPRVFDKFFQVDMRARGARRSSGLGLTFCKLAVEAHGGEIGVESEPEKGSLFWFSLPLAGPEERSDAESPIAP